MTKTIIAITFLATILLILPIASIPAYAPSTSFTVTPAGVQAHTLGANCYAFIPAFGISFGSAFADAQAQSVNGVPGHLATLNSAAEEAFADAVAVGQKGWIGYTRDPGFLIPGAPTVTERDGFQWGWVTGETPVYTNWVSGGPNNANNNELYAENNAFQPNFWNDIDFFNRNFPESGYFAEFPGCLANFLVIDEDSIDNGNPPNFFEDGTINDDIADIGLRTPLPAFSGTNIGTTITLHTGEVGDEGWFALETIPDSWNTAGPTADGLRNFFLAGPGLGTEDDDGDRESQLDKIPDVTPLRATGLNSLVGERVCAVVYDSDISINYDPLDGSLKGSNLGIVAFEVISVTELTGFSDKSLPKVDIEILDASRNCEGLQLTEAPAPESSSEPEDVVP